LQSAVSRISNPPTIPAAWRLTGGARLADCNSAIQQIANLRYASL